MPQGILVVEDEATLAKNVKRYLERYDYQVRIASRGSEALEEFESFKPDLVLLDLNLPDMSGLEILERIRTIDSRVKVILLTAHGNVQVAVDAMKAGAYDYLSKPVAMSALKQIIDKAVGEERLEGTLSYYRERDASESGMARILGESQPIRQLKQRITQILEAEKRLSDDDLPAVLITGETGTGKELVARSLHFDGGRRDQPFVEINATSIPAQLLESELFGYERGAFTDARERKLGLVESAHGGTLFLDEIGDIDATTQVKLLKLLEDKMVRRLGSVRDRKVNIRILTATNRSLETLVQEGSFRSDLFFRLRVVQLQLPALRDCGDDVILLVEHFLHMHGRRYGKPGLRLSPAARDMLLQHSWPGNVRELRNVMEQVVLMAPGDVVEPDLLPFIPAPAPAAARTPAFNGAAGSPVPGGSARLVDVERDLIVKALRDSGGNVTRASKMLGLSRDTLRYRIEKYGLRSSA